MSELKVRSYISIDYSKSKAQVFEEIARYSHSDSGDRSILAFVESVDLEFRSALPSWVPDWAVNITDDFGLIRAR